MKFLVLSLLLISGLAAQPLDLSGTWKWHSGDDPQFAKPEFDDSGWGSIELPRRGRSLGVSWVRRTVTAPVLQNAALAVGSMDPCYDVFVNGLKIGQNRCEPNEDPPSYRPRSFPISEGLLVQGKPVVIAFRMEGRSLGRVLIAPVRDEGPYLLTSVPHSIDAAQKGLLLILRAIIPFLLGAYTQFGVAILLFIIWLSTRQRLELLWFSGCLLCLFANNVSVIQFIFFEKSHFIPTMWAMPLAYFFLNRCAHIVFGVKPLPRWIIGAFVMATVGIRISMEASFYLIPAMALPVWWSARKVGSVSPEQRYFAIAILVYSSSLLNILFKQLTSYWPLETGTYVGPFMFAFAPTISTLVSLAIMLVLLRIVGQDRQDKYRLAAEVEAARGVQQVLLAQSSGTAGFQLDAVYEPAQEVGGDFYWTRTDPDGALLIMVGDVSGKGLKAAMLVTLIIGALRQRAERMPAQILALLNEAVSGETHNGFVTACCLRIESTGAVTIANAGHLSPYYRGQELTVEAGLPLGIATGVAYEETLLQLHPGESIMLLSDGVVEAENAKRELFGFDRTRESSGKSAQEIAEAAKAWGQNDDITVVTVRRND